MLPILLCITFNLENMIVSNLQNSGRIESLHPQFKPLFDYVKTHDLLHAELGRIYIDVHILLEGTERIGWKAIEDVKQEIKPYDKEGDCALYADPSTTWVDLLPGQFMIVYPEDPHAPVVGAGNIRKLIAKVKI